MHRFAWLIPQSAAGPDRFVAPHKKATPTEAGVDGIANSRCYTITRPRAARNTNR